MENKTWFTCYFAAKETEISEELIRYYAKQGKIKWQFIDGKIQIPLEEVRRLKYGKLPPIRHYGAICPSEIIVCSEYLIVIANNTGNEFIFDLDMYDILMGRSWNVNGSGYLGASINNANVMAHHLIIGFPPEGYVIDHIDRNRNNNRRNNLRFLTISQNAMNSLLCSNNTSGFRGVTWDKNRKKWKAAIRHFDKTLNIGRFPTAIEAAIAYDRKAFEIFGDIVMTNKKMGLIN